MWPTDYPAYFDKEYVCDASDCDNCTFDPCYYADGDEEWANHTTTHG